MAAIDELISTYLTACEVEGKTANTVTAYRATLRDFRRVGGRLRLPDSVESYSAPDVYAYPAELRERGASAAYQRRGHREVKALSSWCRCTALVADNSPIQGRSHR